MNRNILLSPGAHTSRREARRSFGQKAVRLEAPPCEGGSPQATYGSPLRDRLGKSDPGNAEWQRDLVVSYVKLAGIDRTSTRSFLTRALEAEREMQRKGQLAPRGLWMLDDLAQRIAALAK